MGIIRAEDLYDITFGTDDSYSCFVDAKDISYHAKPLKNKDKAETVTEDGNDNITSQTKAT